MTAHKSLSVKQLERELAVIEEQYVCSPAPAPPRSRRMPESRQQPPALTGTADGSDLLDTITRLMMDEFELQPLTAPGHATVASSPCAPASTSSLSSFKSTTAHAATATNYDSLAAPPLVSLHRPGHHAVSVVETGSARTLAYQPGPFALDATSRGSSATGTVHSGSDTGSDVDVRMLRIGGISSPGTSEDGGTSSPATNEDSDGENALSRNQRRNSVVLHAASSGISEPGSDGQTSEAPSSLSTGHSSSSGRLQLASCHSTGSGASSGMDHIDQSAAPAAGGPRRRFLLQRGDMELLFAASFSSATAAAAAAAGDEASRAMADAVVSAPGQPVTAAAGTQHTNSVVAAILATASSPRRSVASDLVTGAQPTGEHALSAGSGLWRPLTALAHGLRPSARGSSSHDMLRPASAVSSPQPSLLHDAATLRRPASAGAELSLVSGDASTRRWRGGGAMDGGNMHSSPRGSTSPSTPTRHQASPTTDARQLAGVRLRGSCVLSLQQALQEPAGASPSSAFNIRPGQATDVGQVGVTGRWDTRPAGRAGGTSGRWDGVAGLAAEVGRHSTVTTNATSPIGAQTHTREGTHAASLLLSSPQHTLSRRPPHGSVMGHSIAPPRSESPVPRRAAVLPLPSAHPTMMLRTTSATAAASPPPTADVAGAPSVATPPPPLPARRIASMTLSSAMASSPSSRSRPLAGRQAVGRPLFLSPAPSSAGGTGWRDRSPFLSPAPSVVVRESLRHLHNMSRPPTATTHLHSPVEPSQRSAASRQPQSPAVSHVRRPTVSSPSAAAMSATRAAASQHVSHQQMPLQQMSLQHISHQQRRSISGSTGWAIGVSGLQHSPVVGAVESRPAARVWSEWVPPSTKAGLDDVDQAMALMHRAVAGNSTLAMGLDMEWAGMRVQQPRAGLVAPL